MILDLVDEAVAAGARRQQACQVIGVSARTLQRWRHRPAGGDLRCGPRHQPPNALSDAERERVWRILNSPEFFGLSPKQVVPRLADQGVYVASESTMYRLLRELRPARRPRPRGATATPLAAHTATGPNQLWSWDITYLPTTVRGKFLRLYMMMDVWSRKVVGWAVHESETSEHAATLVTQACADEGVHDQLVLHSDNGSPMRGSTMLVTLQWLGVVPSFSRPGVCNDNPFSESLFRTMKYTPAYPHTPFVSLEAARRWVARFVDWYNREHLHSRIGFVTPDQRHTGQAAAILAKRERVYERAKRRHPKRWAGATRKWMAQARVDLNPKPMVATA